MSACVFFLSAKELRLSRGLVRHRQRRIVLNAKKNHCIFPWKSRKTFWFFTGNVFPFFFSRNAFHRGPRPLCPFPRGVSICITPLAMLLVAALSFSNWILSLTLSLSCLQLFLAACLHIYQITVESCVVYHCATGAQVDHCLAFLTLMGINIFKIKSNSIY